MYILTIKSSSESTFMKYYYSYIKSGELNHKINKKINVKMSPSLKASKV